MERNFDALDDLEPDLFRFFPTRYALNLSGMGEPAYGSRRQVVLAIRHRRGDIDTNSGKADWLTMWGRGVATRHRW